MSAQAGRLLTPNFLSPSCLTAQKNVHEALRATKKNGLWWIFAQGRVACWHHGCLVWTGQARAKMFLKKDQIVLKNNKTFVEGLYLLFLNRC